jgi:hypothetical protein
MHPASRLVKSCLLGITMPGMVTEEFRIGEFSGYGFGVQGQDAGFQL